MREEFNASRFSTEPTKLHAPTHPFTEFSHFLSLMPWNTFCVSLRFAFSKYLRKIRFLPPLSTLRYMGKNSVRLNWSNARKLTTSSGKKIPRFFAEKKKSYPSKVTPCASWRYSYIFYPTSHRIRFYAWIRFSLDTCLSCIISVWNIPTRNRVPSRWI